MISFADLNRAARKEASPSFLPYFLGRPGVFFACWPGSLKTVLFERKPGHHVKPLAKLGVQGLEQPVIAEPGVGDRYSAGLTKYFGNTGYHFGRLCQLGLKFNLRSIDAPFEILNVLLEMIEPVVQRQTCPAPLDHP